MVDRARLEPRPEIEIVVRIGEPADIIRAGQQRVEATDLERVRHFRTTISSVPSAEIRVPTLE